jgi:hypothetical protein
MWMQPRTSSVQFGRGTSQGQGTSPAKPARAAIAAREQRWRRLTWPVSLALFAVPVALALCTLLVPRFAGPPKLTVQVSDRYTGQSIAGAEILANGSSVTTGPDGSTTLLLSKETTDLQIQAPGYEGVTATLGRDAPPDWSVALRPNTLAGRLTDKETSSAIGGADVALVAPGGAQRTTSTDADGRYAFEAVPENATIRFSDADYGPAEEPIDQRTTIDFSMQPTFVTGRITDATGAPVAGARIAAKNGSAETFTNADGTFRLTGGSDVQDIAVSAAGFATQSLAVGKNREIDAQLDGELIKAVYANLGVLGDADRWNTLLNIADTTEINAIVIDVKQDTIYYDTQVKFFRDIDGVVTPVLDLPSLVAQMHEHGIYAIARMVVFKDPLVAEGRPDLAVKDEVTGEPWLDMNGTPWVNAFNQELWEANADLAAELIQIGFDEVQYDYIRFPSDGDLRTADFGNSYSEDERRAAIKGAVALGEEKVHAAGGQFAIDLFPIVALLGDDEGIGQTLQDLAPLADYVCLMIYPSHYERGNIPVDGHPNDFPSETVTYTLQQSQEWAPDTLKKMRPWLQDFTYPMEGYSAYGPDRVRAEIDAAEAMGVSGWMLWNAAGEFQVSALDPG